MDYLPLGKYDELHQIVSSSSAKKYLVLRGILDQPSAIRPDIMGGRAQLALERHYARILVACDRKICDVAAEYALPPDLAAKTTHVGYVSEPISEHDINLLRADRGLAPSDKWVVCSAGGGALGEDILFECLQVATAMSGVHFDIVLGPKSHSRLPLALGCSQSGNIRLHKQVPRLSMLHASADVVVCTAGYNTLVEALEGHSRIICKPTQIGEHMEQITHVQRLASFMPISILNHFYELPRAVQSSLDSTSPKPRVREVLDFDGALRIREAHLFGSRCREWRRANQWGFLSELA